jgi:hypothetical protein
VPLVFIVRARIVGGGARGGVAVRMGMRVRRRGLCWQWGVRFGIGLMRVAGVRVLWSRVWGGVAIRVIACSVLI